MEKETFSTRVIPFVRSVTKTKNGKTYKEVVDNLTSEERRNMSCEPRMLWERKDNVYVAEMPLSFKEGTGVKWVLCYVFDELTEEEQKKYFDRSIVITTTIKDVVKVYGESSKRFFGKTRTKERK